MDETRVLSDEQIARRVKVIRTVYAWLAWLGGICVIFVLLGLSKKYPRIQALETFIAVWAYSFTYYGLKGRKEWVIPLLLIMSAVTVIRSLLAVLEPANDLASFLHKIVESAFVLFSAYQIYVFRRREVREFFGANGKVVV